MCDWGPQISRNQMESMNPFFIRSGNCVTDLEQELDQLALKHIRSICHKKSPVANQDLGSARQKRAIALGWVHNCRLRLCLQMTLSWLSSELAEGHVYGRSKVCTSHEHQAWEIRLCFFSLFFCPTGPLGLASNQTAVGTM